MDGMTANLLTSDQQTLLAAWQRHTHAEFVLRDADAALTTMTENPYLLVIATGPHASAEPRCVNITRTIFCRRSHPISRVTR